jgi:hypothetical protein
MARKEKKALPSCPGGGGGGVGRVVTGVFGREQLLSVKCRLCKERERGCLCEDTQYAAIIHQFLLLC